MAEHSRYQQGVIRRYYENREQIDEQKLGELVTSLFLEESAKKKKSMWERAATLMERLGIPERRRTHVVDSADPATLAAVIEDLRAGRIRREKKD